MEIDLYMRKRGSICYERIAIKFESQTSKQQNLMYESVITDSWNSTLQHVAETYVEVFLFSKNKVMFEHQTITIELILYIFMLWTTWSMLSGTSSV